MVHSLRAWPVFALVVLVTLALLGFIGLMLFSGLLGLEAIASMGHFSSLDHRIHDLTYAFLFGTAAVGMLAQLRTPWKNVAGQLMALIPWIGFVLAFALGNILVSLLRPPFVPIFGALALIATMLHPTWRDLFSSFSVSRVNRVMLTLVIIAAIPLLAFAFTNIGLQRTAVNSHAAMSHYGYMVAFSFTVIGVGFLASLRPDGWWLPAWVAGLLPALLGLAALVFPDAASSLSLAWAIAAIAWGVVFVAAAELTQAAESPTPLGSWGMIPTLRGSRRVISEDNTHVKPDHGPATGTPRWVNVFGSIALVPILLAVITMVVGVAASGGHGPGGYGDASPVADGAVEIAVTADNFAFDPDEISVTAGDDVAIVLTSVDMLHDFVIDELSANAAAKRGETAPGGFRADRPGRYTFYCSVPGHRQTGMEGTLIVTEDLTLSGGPGGHTPPF